MCSHTHTYVFIILGEGKGVGREIPFECYSPVWKNKEGKQNIFSFHQNRKERGNGVGSRSIDIMDCCQCKEIVPFYPKLGGWGGGEIYGSMIREGCIPSSPLDAGTCVHTGKCWEISAPQPCLFSLNPARAAHPQRCEMPLPSPSPQSTGQEGTAGESPLPPCRSGTLPSECACTLVTVPLPHPLLSARFLPAVGEMEEVVRGWGNPSDAKTGRGVWLPGKAWQVPSNACSPGDTFPPFPLSRWLCQGFTHPWKAFSQPVPGAGRQIMQALGTLRLCFSPAPNANTRLLCLSLSPSFGVSSPSSSIKLSSVIRESRQLSCQHLWGQWCKTVRVTPNNPVPIPTWDSQDEPHSAGGRRVKPARPPNGSPGVNEV